MNRNNKAASNREAALLIKDGDFLICKKCNKNLPDDALLCCYCGQPLQAAEKKTKSRGNGQGSVYQLKNKKYIAVKTLGYYLDETGKKHRKTITKRFDRKKDAIAALSLLGLDQAPDEKARKKARTTFLELYKLWLPTHQAGKNTMDCYRAAIKYFSPLYHQRVADVDVDDLQECIDECPRAKSTRKNMRVVVGLMYKYGIPRGYLPEKLNLADYLSISGETGVGGVGLPEEYLTAIRGIVDTSTAAAYVVCNCYLGFRPSEFLELDLESYDPQERAFRGGAKTDAGKDRIVTVSPQIQPLIDRIRSGRSSGAFFCTQDGSRMGIKAYRSLFYELLDYLELENPIYEVNGKQRHTYTPHSCRHTFATLMKRVAGANKDKLELIGHSSDEMLRYYQDVTLEDLRKITDAI